MPKTYHGKRGGDHARVTVTEDGTTRPLRHIVHHSPTGFEWGYGGSGPADLALALCADVLGERPSVALYQAVKESLVCGIAEDEWHLSDVVLLDHIARAKERIGEHGG